GIGQLQLQGAGEVLDGRDVGKGLSNALLEEPLERITLHGHQIRQRHDFTELCERETPASRETGQSLTPYKCAKAPQPRGRGKRNPETPNGQHSDSLRWLATALSRLHRAHDLRRIRLTLMQVKG